MNTDVMFSSATGEWGTPQDFYEAVDKVCHFTLDVCATPQNAKCTRYFNIEDDGLVQIWSGMCWQNPPYGRVIEKWVGKAHTESAKDGTSVVCLVPARTDTGWWHRHAIFSHRIYIRGRLKFGGQTNSAPFPSALLVFGAPLSLAEQIQESLLEAGYRSSF